jgi:hypothetical protein
VRDVPIIGTVLKGIGAARELTVESHYGQATGRTAFLDWEFGALASDFFVSVQDSLEECTLFTISGYAQSVSPLGAIDYTFKVGWVDTHPDEVSITGSHDGFPSYTLSCGQELVYDFQETNMMSLYGSSDTSMPVIYVDIGG